VSKKRQPERITRDDIERQLRSLTTDVKSDVMSEQQKIVVGGVVAVVVILLVVFLLGRRAGRKRTTLVEIRRV
jgi:flagellar biosynthesis/type III secretory pathway M-ring protein FliF/YscJ